MDISKNDEDKSVKSERALVANSTHDERTYDCDAIKEDEDVPLVFSMKQRRISKYNFKRDFKTGNSLEEARPCTGDSEMLTPAKNSSSSEDEENDDDQ